MLIKRKLFQISLITLGLIIVFLTYFTNLEKNQQEDFKVSEKPSPVEKRIDDLKITVRKLTNEDIKERKLPNQTDGLLILSIDKNSPLSNSIEVNSIILEVQKKKINSVNELEQIINKVLKTDQKTILFVIYNSQNQRRYIGVKLK